MNLFTRKEIRRLGYYFLDSAEERIYLNSLNRELKKRSRKNEAPEKVKEDMIIELRSQRKRLLLKADNPPVRKIHPPQNSQIRQNIMSPSNEGGQGHGK